jgi:uncharacterized protein (TIGR03000 family)
VPFISTSTPKPSASFKPKLLAGDGGCTKNGSNKNGGCAKNGSGNKNGNDNKNGSGNKNGNDNKNRNGNDNTNINDITVRVNVGRGSKNDNSNSNDNSNNNGGNNGYGFGNNGYGFGNNGFSDNGFSNGNGNGGGGYSPTNNPNYSPVNNYSPSYSFGSSPGYGVTGVGAVGAVGLVPAPNAVFNDDDPNTAWLTMELPNEQAEVWLNDIKMPHKGLTRKYVSPPLDPKLVYNYDIKVQWNEAGAKQNYNAKVSFKAGDEINHVVPKLGAKAVPMPKLEPSDEDNEKAANGKLNMVKDLIKGDKMTSVKARLEDIIKKYPNTKAATEAKELLSKL